MFHLNFISMPSAFVDVWKLDFRYIGVHRHGHYSNLKGKWCMSLRGKKNSSEEDAVLIGFSSVMTVGAGDTLLDMDEPFCHVGLHRVLLHILLVLWGNYMVPQHFILIQHKKSKKQYTVSRLEMKWTFNQNSNKICLTRHQEMQLTRIRLNNP